MTETAPQITTLDTVIIEKSDRVGRIVFNRPDRLNTFTPQMLEDYTIALDTLEGDEDVRVIVVKGAGRSFCAGWELQPGSDTRVERSFSDDLAAMDEVVGLTMRLWHSPKVTIAQIHGHCLGGGLQFGLDCDLVYAADDAAIGQPEARSMGLVPDIGLWPLTINIRRTKELVLAGDIVTGVEAAQMGMINCSKPADQLETYVEWMAARVSSLDTETIALQKLALNQLADLQQLATMVGIGKSNNLIQHKQRGRAAFAALAKEDGVRSALKHRDGPFGGPGVPQSKAWAAHLAARLAETNGAADADNARGVRS